MTHEATGSHRPREITYTFDKREIATLKTLMVQIEMEYCRKGIQNVTEAQEKDKRLKLLYKILGYT